MQSIQPIQSKSLIKFTYVEYKRQIEQLLADHFIPKEIIPRHAVEETKCLFGEAFQQHDVDSDHIVGCQLHAKNPLPPSGREYDQSNNWGKVALRMVSILRTLQPVIFFDVKRIKGHHSSTSIKIVNPFITTDATKSTDAKKLVNLTHSVLLFREKSPENGTQGPENGT